MSNGFYIGQKVVCVKSHSQGVTREGVMYVVNGVKKCAICGNPQIDVGVPATASQWMCGPEAGCGHVSPTHGIWWQGAHRFRPLDELHDQIERIEKEGAPQEVEYQPA